MVHRGQAHTRAATLAAAVLTVVATAASAQSQSDVPSGSLIITRDVPARAADAKEPPGTPHYVQLDRSDLVNGALASGLAPLDDLQIGNIASGPTPQLAILSEVPPDTGTLSNISGDIKSSTNQLGSLTGALGSSGAGGIAGALAAPLQSLNQAMSALSAALPGPH